MGSSDFEDDETDVPAEPQEASPLFALVSIAGVVSSHALPGEGELAIGRTAGCDLVIDHPSVSRRHGRLRVAPLAIVDSGSRNGTRVRGATLPPEVATAFEIGESIQLGEATLLIQRGVAAFTDADTEGPAPRTGDALLRQLEIECTRSARSCSPFAYVRVHGATRAALEPLLRTSDVLGVDAADRLQLLLLDTTSEQAAAAVARLGQQLEQRGVPAQLAVARYPRDGVTAEQLEARAHEQLDPRARPSEMDRLRTLIAQVAESDVSVLITGETGVGKELCAEMIHRLSPRAARPFVKLNCSTIAESLIESELFGHERGAFTGATTATPGLFEAGDGGTIFLDEIGELPPAAQAKLLRVLEERVVRRVGAAAGRTLDVRFVCATNRVLPDEVAAGRFRRDLFYRIQGVTLAIPPLRERPVEIAALARAFAARARGSTGRSQTLGADVLEALEHHSWPGNIRELRNTIERAALLAGSGAIRPVHLAIDDPRRERPGVTQPMPRATGEPASEEPLAAAVADLERRRILDTLERCGGNQTRAARLLGISRNTLLARLDAYGLPRPRKS